MSPEAAVASHACAHIGAVQVPIFSGFAAPAVVQRLQDSQAKVVITADYSLRRGTRVPMRETIDEALREAPSVEHVLVWRRDDDGAGTSSSGRASCRRSRSRPSTPTCSRTRPARPAGRRARCTCTGSFLLSIAREAAYQADIRAGDRVLFSTDMGWIMGPWTVVGAGALGRLRDLHGGRARLAATTGSGGSSRRSA